jgi:tetratricopeptide (TPR) repeat protein
MNFPSRLAWLSAASLLLGTGPAAADTTPSFDKAPPEIRAYLEQARRADFMPDPMARCLAWPELPGNRWPKGLAEEHCRVNYDQVLTLAEVDGYLARGETAALDERLERELDRHFLDEGASEIIHGHFYAFEGKYEAGRVSQRWLEAAPDSPYAHAARGIYYVQRAWDARGGAFAQKTPRENFQRMSALVDTAVEHLDKAIELEPRLIVAHAALVEVASLASRDELMVRAVRAADQLDPGCRAWTQEYARSLEPKWGGSWESLRSFAESRERQIHRRPMMAITAAMPLIEEANQLRRAKRYEESLKVAEEAMRLSTHIAPMRDAGLSMVHIESADRWRQLMYLLAESRTPDGSEPAAWVRAELLLDLAKDLEWGAMALERAVAMEPANSWGQHSLGIVRVRQGRLEEAFPAFDEAIADPGVRESALYFASHAAIENKLFERARPYVDRLQREYPEQAWGWYFAGHLGFLEQDGHIEVGGDVHQAFKKFVELADRDDPDQRKASMEISRWLRVLDREASRAETRAERSLERDGKEP